MGQQPNPEVYVEWNHVSRRGREVGRNGLCLTQQAWVLSPLFIYKLFKISLGFSILISKMGQLRFFMELV